MVERARGQGSEGVVGRSWGEEEDGIVSIERSLMARRLPVNEARHKALQSGEMKNKGGDGGRKKAQTRPIWRGCCVCPRYR